MIGSVLISGGNKKERLEKAWELLTPYGFLEDSQHPDLLVIQKEPERKSVGILQAKEVRKFLQERPFQKKVKAVVIEDSQLLTDDAQGSLLKVLEEPPSYALIILLCDKEGSLLPTVISRCRKIIIHSSAVKEKSFGYDIAAMSYEQVFDLAKDLSAKGKEEALDFLENVLRHDVRSGNLEAVEILEKSIKELKDSNAALKFALEYLFLIHKV